MRPGTLLRWHALKNILKSEIQDGVIIFDIGSYDGYISYKLKKIFPNLKITVIDVDKSGLQIAKERGLSTLYSSGLKLPIKDNLVDVVFCLDLLEHVEEDNILMKEISRILKINGKIILTTPMQNGITFPFLSKEKIEIINKGWGHLRRGYGLERIQKLFENHGLFIEKKSSYFNFFTRLIYRFSVISKISCKGKNLLYRTIIKLEPYFKRGTQEHLIIGRKGRV